MASTPSFVATPVIGLGTLSAANANRDGTGTIVTILTAGSSGTRIHKIVIKATVTTTAGMIRLFLHDGTNYFLWKEISVSAITPSATVQAFESITQLFGEDALTIPSGYSLRMSTEKAETFKVSAEGGNI